MKEEKDMTRKSNYRKALKKYGAKGVLNLYLHSKIELTQKEWQDIHKKINKDVEVKDDKMFFGKYIALVICVIIISLIAINSVGDYMDQVTKCKGIKGYLCNQYQVEKE